MPDQTPAQTLRTAAFRLRAPIPLDMPPDLRFALAELLQAEGNRQELFAKKGMRAPDCQYALAVARALLGSSS